jgi:uncharacterized protein YcbK (DUF882 family)
MLPPSPRRLLIGAAFGLVLLPGRAHAQARRIAIRHAGTGARFAGIWHDGRAPDRQAMADLSRVLADPGIQAPRGFDPAAIGILWEVALRAGLSGEIEIHSGYRTPAVNRAVDGAGDSEHLRAAALDVGVGSARVEAVGGIALGLARGGVGLYRERGFVHLDSGPVRQWGEAGGARRVPAGLTPRGEALARGAGEWIRRPGR